MSTFCDDFRVKKFKTLINNVLLYWCFHRLSPTFHGPILAGFIRTFPKLKSKKNVKCPNEDCMYGLTKRWRQLNKYNSRAIHCWFTLSLLLISNFKLGDGVLVVNLHGNPLIMILVEQKKPSWRFIFHHSIVKKLHGN